MTRSLLDRVTATLPTVSGGRWIVAGVPCRGCAVLIAYPLGAKAASCANPSAVAAAWLPDPERLHHVRNVVGHAADLLLSAGFYIEGRAVVAALWICDDSAAPADRGTDMDAALNRYLAASDALRESRGPVVRVARPELDAWYDKHGGED